MSTNRITVYVTETLRHKVEIDLSEEDANSLVEGLDGPDKDEVAGGLTNGVFSCEEGAFELDSYEVADIVQPPTNQEESTDVAICPECVRAYAPLLKGCPWCAPSATNQ